jgi:hypothetical protein
MGKFLSVTAVFLLSLEVVAAPIYLGCKLDDPKQPRGFSVKLDEESTKVTHTNADGSAFNADGFFAADKVSWQRVSVDQRIKIVYLYEVNRSTLATSETFSLAPLDPKYAQLAKPPIVTMGVCELVEAPADRKF